MKLESLLKLKGQEAAKAFTELEHLSQYYLCMKVDGTNYILRVFFPDEEMEDCQGDYEKLDWESPYYQYTVD